MCFSFILDFFQSNKLNDYALIMRIIICPNQTLYAELKFEGLKAMFECPIFLIGRITVLAFGNETTKCNVAFSLKNASAVTISKI